MLDARVARLAETPIRNWVDRRAWELADDRFLRRHGFENDVRVAALEAMVTEYRDVVEDILSAKVGRQAGYGVWRRRRWQRLRNMRTNLPDSAVGQFVQILIAYPRSFKYSK